jgi:hypothetical protein
MAQITVNGVNYDFKVAGGDGNVVAYCVVDGERIESAPRRSQRQALASLGHRLQKHLDLVRAQTLEREKLARWNQGLPITGPQS